MKNLIPSVPTNILSHANYSPGSIVSKIIFQSDAVQITLFAMAKGEEFGEHSVTKRALVHILEGEGEFEFPDKKSSFKSNDYFIMEEDFDHAMTAATDVKFLLYIF